MATETKILSNEAEAMLLNEEPNDVRSIEIERTALNDTKMNIVLKEDISEFDEVERICVIHVFKNFKISINKTLLPLRIALFLWYGAAKTPITYLTVFMKQKGLSLVEYSSVFSVTFVFQFLTSFLSGIVADKIGSAKPVLIFHILVTMFSVLSFLLAPRINVCSSFLDNTYTENNNSIIIQKYENISETLINRFVNAEFNNETELLNNESFISYSSPNITHVFCGGREENCTASNFRSFENNCIPIRGNFLILYIIVIIIFLSSWSSVYRFMDITAISVIQKYNTSFGYERFFSITGDLVITFCTGVVLDAFTSTGEENNYESIYWFAICMFCILLVAVYSIKVHIKPPSQNMWKKGFSLLRNIDVVVFIIVLFSLGTFSCFIDNFTLWFLEYLNASTIIFGLHQALNALYGLPFYLTSKWFLQIFGTKQLFIAGFFGYIIYGVGYSFLYNPWWSLLIEASSVLTYHLLWVAVIVHSHHLAPKELVSTVIATAGAIHFGIGRSSGIVIGGLVMNAVGPRITFRIFAGMSFVAATLYALYLYYRRYREKQRK